MVLPKLHVDLTTMSKNPYATNALSCGRWKVAHPSVGFADVAIAARAGEVTSTSARGIPDSGGKF